MHLQVSSFPSAVSEIGTARAESELVLRLCTLFRPLAISTSPTLILLYLLSVNMDLDEEPPPLLVATDGIEAVDQNLSSELDDTKITKVPISIITGRWIPVVLARGCEETRKRPMGTRTPSHDYQFSICLSHSGIEEKKCHRLSPKRDLTAIATHNEHFHYHHNN